MHGHQSKLHKRPNNWTANAEVWQQKREGSRGMHGAHLSRCCDVFSTEVLQHTVSGCCSIHRRLAVPLAGTHCCVQEESCFAIVDAMIVQGNCSGNLSAGRVTNNTTRDQPTRQHHCAASCYNCPTARGASSHTQDTSKQASSVLFNHHQLVNAATGQWSSASRGHFHAVRALHCNSKSAIQLTQCFEGCCGVFAAAPCLLASERQAKGMHME